MYSNSLYKTKEVNTFIEDMYTKHNYDKEKLKKLFQDIKEEKSYQNSLKLLLREGLRGMDVMQEKHSV